MMVTTLQQRVLKLRTAWENRPVMAQIKLCQRLVDERLSRGTSRQKNITPVPGSAHLISDMHQRQLAITSSVAFQAI